MVCFPQIILYTVHGLQPILVVETHFLLGVKATNKISVDRVTIKHSPLLASRPPANRCLGVGTNRFPHPMFCELPQVVQSDTDSNS